METEDPGAVSGLPNSPRREGRKGGKIAELFSGLHADRQVLQIKSGGLTRNHLRSSDCNVRRTAAGRQPKPPPAAAAGLLRDGQLVCSVTLAPCDGCGPGAAADDPG